MSGSPPDPPSDTMLPSTVTVLSLERGDSRTFQTDEEGDYYGRGYRTDRYLVTMAAAGFQGQQQEVKVNFGMNTVDGRLATAVAPSDVSYDDINGLYQAGFSAYEQEDWVAARDAMAPMIAALAGMSGEEADTMRASGLEVLGRAQFEVGEYEAAIATYERLLEIDPDSVAAHAWKSQTHVRMQDFEAALPHVRRAAALAPDDAAMQYNAAVILLQTDAIDEGIVAMERAVELRSDFPLARKQLGYAYLRLGGQDPSYYEKALASLREYLELAPEAADRAEVEGMIAALETQIQG
jgi:tetratricopeptide (TPR) repeat protein